MLALCVTFLLGANLPAFDVEKHVLPNGLEVILSVDHRLPIVAINLAYHTGAIDEPRDRTGFAHLFEHLMFQGSEHVPDEAHFQWLSDAGATTVNAETGFDLTVYYETVPSNVLPLALWLEADRMGYLLGALDEQKLATQREVVKNERRQNLEDAPYGRAEEAMLKALFPATHPYRDGVIGSIAHLDAATLDDARAFFKARYAPSNATLVISGDIDKAKTLELVERYFGAFAAQPKPAATRPPVPSKPLTARLVVDDPIATTPKLWCAWVTPPFGAEDDVALEAWAEILAGGKASRLYEALVIEAGVAEDVAADTEALAGGSMFEIAVTPLQNVKIEELERATLSALERALTAPVTVAELRRVIARDETARLIDLESPGGDDGLANMLQLFNHYTGDPNAYRAERQRYAALTPAHLSSAKRWLAPDRRLLVVAKPNKASTPDAPPAAAEPVASKAVVTPPRIPRPPLGVEPALSLPTFTRAELSNGLAVYVSEDHSLPLVAISLAVQAGGAFDPPGRTGTSAALFAWLAEGAGGRDAAQLDAAFGELGAVLDTHASRDGGFVQTVVTKDRVEPAAALLSDVLLRPSFDRKALTALKLRLLASRAQAKADPGFIGLETLQSAIFSSVHPYGRPLGGSTSSIGALGHGDLERFYAQHVHAGGTDLVFVGDITLAEARAIAEKSFSTMKRGERSRVAVTPLPPNPFKALRLYGKPDLGQSFIGFGTRTIGFGHQDQEALDLASDVFAGLFNSRLNTRLREELAITYGASGAHASMRYSGAFLAFAQVRADATAEGVKESLAILANLQKRPITQAELDSAKLGFLRSLPGRFTHRYDSAATFAALRTVGAEPDALRRMADRVRKITLDRVRRAAATYLRPETMQVILVADPAKAHAALDKSLPIEDILDE